MIRNALYLDVNVYNEAKNRIRFCYEHGEVIVSFSAGKDSGVVVELCIEVARELGRLPVKVVLRDEEIMLPGTYEYAEYIHDRPEVDMKWLIAGQPIINIFSRTMPYWWVFDDRLPPEKWVRRPPAYAQRINRLDIAGVNDPSLFGIKDGTKTYIFTGMRCSESPRRKMGVQAKRGFITRGPSLLKTATPIYDWSTTDIWLYIKEKGLQYNTAYNAMYKLGIKAARMRIGPPTMTPASADELAWAKNVWPNWFARCCDRLDGLRLVAFFGRRVIQPIRRRTETWKQCFHRVCISDAPAWIRDRAIMIRDEVLRNHATHSTEDLPEIQFCKVCAQISVCSWKNLAHALYNGDPFSLRTHLPYVEPEFFRTGAGQWGGKPTW